MLTYYVYIHPPPLCFKIYYFVRNCLMHTHAWLSQGSKKTATNCSSSSLHTRNGNLGLFLKMLGKVVSSRKYLTLAMLSLQDSSQTKNKILLPYVGWSCPILIFQFWENSKSFMQPCGGTTYFLPHTTLPAYPYFHDTCSDHYIHSIESTSFPTYSFGKKGITFWKLLPKNRYSEEQTSMWMLP